MLRILAPTDFSIDGYNATLVAMQLAQRFGAQVIFAHAMSKPPVPATSPEDLFSTIYREEERKIRERLHDECQHLFDILNLRHADVQYSTLVVPTPFADAMLQIINREKIDLVVMGSRGSSELKQILLGSNTLELMRLTPVPLLIIPSNVVFDGYQTITILFEQKKLDYPPGIALLLRLARSYDAVLHFLVITRDGNLIQDVKELCAQPEQWQDLLEIQNTVSTLPGSSSISGLEDFIEQTGTNLLVVLPDRRSVWEQLFNREIAEDLAAKAQMPLLVIPPQSQTNV